MPGSGTHTTVIQHLAQENLTFQGPLGNTLTSRDLLGNPNLNMSWGPYYADDDALKSRYAILGAMGPDIFYAMLDYGGDIQMFEDIVIKVLGTFQCVGQVSGEVSKLIDGTLNTITSDVWKSISDVFTNVGAVLKEGALDLVIEEHNFWSLFLPLRQVDDFRSNWYWADYLHYVKTGAFTHKLLEMSRDYSTDEKTTGFLKAYALGYLTHYVADTVGHAYVNRIVESPWRNCWQRHHLVENFIDAYLWDHWHNVSTIPQRPADEQGLDETIGKASASDPARRIGDGAPLHYARLNDLSNIGGLGIDKTIDDAITAVCDQIHSGLFNLGLSSVPPHSASHDAAFITWTNFMSDAMQQTYPPAQMDHPTRLKSAVFDPCRASQGGYPTADDIAGAYGAYRMILSLATEDNLTAPPFPDIVGDISKILADLWNEIKQNLGNIPPPPPIPSSGGFSLDALWDAIKSYGQWLGQVLVAVLKTVGDVIAAALLITGAVVTELIKVALWLLNSILFAVYRNFRMKLVLAAYAVPFTDDLNGTQGQLDLKTLWKTMAGVAQPYPIEPLLSQRDLASNPSNPHSPYRPYFKPSDVMPAPNVELPATFAPTELLAWATPDDMFEKPLGKDNMLMASGPAPPMTAPLPNPDGTVKTTLKSFDGTQRYFGGIFANCEAALRAAVPYVAGGSWPEGTVLPDYNLDSDRGYAWPCWDVDYASMLPWNGCDPYPDDTVSRSKLSLPNNILDALHAQWPLSWGLPMPPPQPGLQSVDPWGMTRSGLAWVNAAPLVNAGAAFPTLSWLTIDPSAKDRVDPEMPTLDDLDKCVAAVPVPPGANLTADYQKAPMEFLQNDPNDSDYMDPDPDAPHVKENDGRLSDFLRAHANLRDPLNILANAVTLSMQRGVVLPSPVPVPSTNNLDALVMAVAQLAITGRDAFSQFNAPQDSQLIQRVRDRNPNPNPPFDEAQLAAAAHNVLDMAYLSLWAIRGNDPGWRKFRTQIDANLDTYFGKPSTPSTYTKWIAVSGFDDTSHRPVNVPTAPYPQFDIQFSTGPFDGKPKPKTTTRYMVASAHTWVGPNDPSLSSFTAADPAWSLLESPPGAPFSSSPAPRTIPNDEPTIPPGNDIIVYIHGGGSRAEEAVALANWLIYEGSLVGHNYTVISLDLPNSAYATRFQVSDVVVGASYDPQKLQVLNFELQYILDFIDALDQKLGHVKDRIKAVMGGSLGGNMSLLLSTKQVSGLETIVAWSVTAVSTMYYLGFISVEWVATFLKHLQIGATDSELTGTPPQDHSKETEYLHHVYFEPLNPTPIPGVVPYMPPDPIMWFRGPDPDPDTPTVIHDWGQCKKDSIKASRFDRYEIYSEQARHWTNAIDLEQISFSFHNDCAVYGLIASSPGSRLLLASGDRDNFAPNAIYNSTLELAHLIRHTAHGKAEFWLDTGHSIHAERPHLFAKEIVNFLTVPGAVDSPYGTVGAPQPAPPSVTSA